MSELRLLRELVGLVYTLQWRHNWRDGVPSHRPHDCLLNRLFRCRSKKTSKLRVTGLCEGYSPATGEFPAQRASNAEIISIWWRHHDTSKNDTHVSRLVMFCWGLLFAIFTVGQRKKVTAVTFFLARPGLDQTAQIRAIYAKFRWMKSCDFWCIEWMWLDLSAVQVPGA